MIDIGRPPDFFIHPSFRVGIRASLLLPFGFVGWGVYGTWFGVLAGLLGIVALVLTFRARIVDRLPIGTLTGFVITAISAVGLSLFLIVWGLGPWRANRSPNQSPRYCASQACTSSQ